MLVKAGTCPALAFVAAVRSTASGTPGKGAFCGPMVAAQAGRGLDAFAGDAVGGAALAQPSPRVVVVASLVGVELSRSASPTSAPGPDWRHALRQGISAWPSWRFAPEMPTERGRQVRSVIQWIFEPYSPRSTPNRACQVPFSGPACAPSRSRSGTDPTHRGRRVHRGSGGGACPTPWPSSTRRSAGAPWPRKARRPLAAAAATCSRTLLRTRSPPAPPGHHAVAGHHPEAATAPAGPPAGTAPPRHPASVAQRSSPRTTAHRPRLR
jgi:hypothetical protein